MSNYTFSIAEKKLKTHQVVAMHLLSGFAISGAGAVISFFNNEIKPIGFLLLASGIGIIAVTISKSKWLAKHPRNLIFRCLEIGVTLSLAAYCYVTGWLLPVYIFGILTAVLSFALYNELRPGVHPEVAISQEGIKVPVNGLTKLINWWDVQHVLYRHGTLTIDCLDNRLYQWMVLPSDTDSHQFEIFCTELITANESKRVKYSW